MEDIKTWLEGNRDLETGRTLYNLYAPRYRPNKVLADQINGYSNSFTRDLISEELEAIRAKIEDARRPEEKPSAKYHTAGERDALPNDLAELDKQIPILFKKRDYLRYEMRKVEPGEKLRLMATRVVKLDLEIRHHYKVLDFWARTGTYPPGFHSDEGQADDERSKFIFWMRAMRSYPSWISRNKNNPEKEEELKAKQKVMAEIDEFLKNADNEE